MEGSSDAKCPAQGSPAQESTVWSSLSVWALLRSPVLKHLERQCQELVGLSGVVLFSFTCLQECIYEVYISIKKNNSSIIGYSAGDE